MEEEAKGLSPHMLQRYILKCFSPIFPGVAVCWPLVGLPLQGLVSITHHRKENIRADPRVAHTQSKANTRCHIRGLSHVLTCFCLFNALPSVSWMVSSSPHWVADTLQQEGTPAMTHNANTGSSRGAWVSYIISCSGYPAPGTLGVCDGNVEIENRDLY